LDIKYILLYFIIYSKISIHSHLHIEFNFAPFKHFICWEQLLVKDVVVVVGLKLVFVVIVAALVLLFEVVVVVGIKVLQRNPVYWNEHKHEQVDGINEPPFRQES
jgi:hypothetical protein